MSVLKKLIAFAAAFSLATPASFAQSAPSPTHAHKRAKVAFGAKPVKARAGEKAFSQPPARLVKVGKKTYVVAQRFTKQGRLLSNLVVGHNFRELKVDEFGTGTASRWELTKGHTAMRASAPYLGHFMKMEIEQQRKKDRVVYNLSYVPRIKRYRVESWYTRKYVSLGADDVIFGDTCSLTNVQDLDNFRKILDKMNGADTSMDSLTCHLKMMSGLIFDAACTDQEPMKDSMPDMVKGLSDILQSGPVKDAASQSGYASSSSGRYLSCLEEHGMAVNSSRIQGLLFESLSEADNSLELAQAEGFITKDPVDAIRNAKSPNCDMDPALLQNLRKNVGNPANDGHPLIMCNMATSQNLTEKDAYRGTYTPGDGYKQISINSPKDTIARVMPVTGHSAESAYASTMLHEFIHSSGVDDENMTLNAEQCCAGPSADGKGKATACKALDSRLAVYEKENRFNGVLTAGTFAGGLSGDKEYINQKLNSGTDGEDFMRRYEQYVGDKIEKESAARAQLTDQNGKTLCSQTNPDPYCVKKQTEFAEKKLLTYTDEFLTDQCSTVITAQNRSEASAKKICADKKLKTMLEQSVRAVPASATVGGVTVAILPDDSSQQAHQQMTVIDPYANLFTVQTGLSGTSSLKMDPAAPGLPNIDSSNAPMSGSGTYTGGSAAGALTGAKPGQAGVGSSTRPDGLDGIKQGEVLADGVNSVGTALGSAVNSVGQTVVPTANASTGTSNTNVPSTQVAEIVVTAKRLPKQTDDDDSSYTPPAPPSSSFFNPVAAPVINYAKTADSSSTTSTAMDYQNPYSSTGSTSSTFPTAFKKSAPADAGYINPAQPAAAADAPQPTTRSAQLVSASSDSSSSGVTASSPGGSSGGGDRNPSSLQALGVATKARAAAGPGNYGSVTSPTLQTPQQLTNWLALDYSRTKDRLLNSTSVSVQLIKLKAEVRGPGLGQGVGCVAARGSCKPNPALIFNYCPTQHRILQAGKRCQ